MGRLQGKVCVVTGAGAGIGRATAFAFAKAGAAVYCVDVDHAACTETRHMIDQLGSAQGWVLIADVATRAGIEHVVENVLKRWHRIDVFHANVGIVPVGTVLDCTEDEWERCMTVNVGSVFLALKAVIPVMIKNGGGSIICTSSVAGIAGLPNRAAYSASKMAIIGLVRATARDYVEQGIRVNAICPGTVDTPSLQERLRASGDYEQAKADFIARQPMDRLGTPEEIANLVVYLASDESAYTTGSVNIIDGGLTL